MFFFRKYTIDSRRKSHKLRRSLQVYKTTHIYCLKPYSSNHVLIHLKEKNFAKFTGKHLRQNLICKRLLMSVTIIFDGSYHGSYYISYHLLYLVLF